MVNKEIKNLHFPLYSAVVNGPYIVILFVVTRQFPHCSTKKFLILSHFTLIIDFRCQNSQKNTS